MTVTHRKRQAQPEEITTISEPGFLIECDGCYANLTHSIRIKCADAACEAGDGVDICPNCFCTGAEFGAHKRSHAYRVVELHSYPIFTADWGADEELLLIEGLALQGIGNWDAIADHIGTRTPTDVKEHYKAVYIDSPNYPLPLLDKHFDVDPAEFQDRKRRRISGMPSSGSGAGGSGANGGGVAPTSAPGIHEIATFLPGRLEFEHELDNEAEDLVKDLEFGLVDAWGGDEIVEDEADADVRKRARWAEERRVKSEGGVAGGGGGGSVAGKGAKGKGMAGKGVTGKNVPGKTNGSLTNGYASAVNGASTTPSSSSSSKSFDRAADREKDKDKDKDKDGDEAEEDAEENLPPIPRETAASVKFKLTLVEMYRQRVERREEGKRLIFQRGLLDYKKMQAADKKRSREEKEILHRLRPFAKLQTAEDYETFCADILYESMLRKRIAELQNYRRLGITNVADVFKLEEDTHKRNQAKANMSRELMSAERHTHLRTGSGRASMDRDRDRERASHERESTPKTPVRPSGRKAPAPLNLANSPHLHLLTTAEQALCSELRILPKPYLVIKETLVREYARRGGKLRRREARDLVKIDVNKTSRVWDFLMRSGYLSIGVAEKRAEKEKERRETEGTPAPTPPAQGQPTPSPVKMPTPRIPGLAPPPALSSVLSGSSTMSQP